MIYFVVLLVLLIVTLLLFRNLSTRGSSFFTFALFVAWLCTGMSSHLRHVNDISTINTKQEIIGLYESKIFRIKESSYFTSKDSSNYLRSEIMREISYLEREIIDIKVSIIKAKIRMKAREDSIFWPFTKI